MSCSGASASLWTRVKAHLFFFWIRNAVPWPAVFGQIHLKTPLKVLPILMVLCWKDHILQEIRFYCSSSYPQVVCFLFLSSILVFWWSAKSSVSSALHSRTIRLLTGETLQKLLNSMFKKKLKIQFLYRLICCWFCFFLCNSASFSGLPMHLCFNHSFLP